MFSSLTNNIQRNRFLFRILISALFYLILSSSLYAQESNPSTQISIYPFPDSLNTYFHSYKHPLLPERLNAKIQSIDADKKEKKLLLRLSASFAYQPFRQEAVEEIYKKVSSLLPDSLRSYEPQIFVGNYSLRDLIPIYYQRRDVAENRFMPDAVRSAHIVPWIRNLSSPIRIEEGLNNRHIALWPSHGRYYKFDRWNKKWAWQRPYLFCTTEDLFTRSIVSPYLIPMLENAGAIVFTPRERSPQSYEIIVDNDTCFGSYSTYSELSNHRTPFFTPSDITGFAQKRAVYYDGENPFREGTVRAAETTKRENQSFVRWIPFIPEEGWYPVYISYATIEKSIHDAHYTVYHKGGETSFSINQQIGGGTWVYLGTFLFAQGANPTGMVALSNYSKEQGIVTADAVRFGAGMGNFSRGGSISHLPRYLEGSRYYAQWAGMDQDVYYSKDGESDYSEDINARSYMTNFLSGGSLQNPEVPGRKVPFELSLALHSDAGYRTTDELIGTLGIYTTDYQNGLLATGTDRLSSRDMADLLLTQIQSDISQIFHTSWQRRYLWDRNYSETRNPVIPSAILEMLSHQNFADMQYGHDPVFKFVLSRSIYKAILRFTARQRRTSYVVQPLPPRSFYITFGDKKNTIELGWQPTDDPTEPTAKPDKYILYTRIGDGGFDNGILVSGTSYQMELKPDQAYSFRVAAVNSGGKSFPSETLTAYCSSQESHRALIVNAFTRLSGPAVVNLGDLAYFDLDHDPGVPYLEERAYSGRQIGRSRTTAGLETENGWGYSTSELEGTAVIGNTFDYPYIHGKAMQASGHVSYVSCSKEALETGRILPVGYHLLDIILGLQKTDSTALHLRQADYRAFTPELRRILTAYLNTRTGKDIPSVLITGSYIASDMNHNAEDRAFLAQTLHYLPAGSARYVSSSEVTGMQRTFALPRFLPTENPVPPTLNNGIIPVSWKGACSPFPKYLVPAPDCLQPARDSDDNFALFCYDNGSPAGVAYQEKDRHIIATGFPFESIPSEKLRSELMTGMLNFLLDH